MDFSEEISVKDIVNFHIKINNASRANKAIAGLSSREKIDALNIINISSAQHNFKIDVAKYFVCDLDPHVCRKAERMLETLVPGWVSDPGENILSLLRSADGKGPAKRNAAVKFLFGVIDTKSLQNTFLTLLNSRNEAHITEIINILEEYVNSSNDELEQVKIFDACLEIVVSDEAEQSIKHHAFNLLSVFFKKVATTQLGDVLHKKYIERQVEKAEGVHRYVCSGAAGLNLYFLEDLIRPLNKGGKIYQTKMIDYFSFILNKVNTLGELDSVLDTYPDYWSKNEPIKEEKVKNLCQRIRQALEELWEETSDKEVREQIIRTKYADIQDKKALLHQIRGNLEKDKLVDASREKILMMLKCFLQPEEDETLKIQAINLLLFSMGDQDSKQASFDYLKYYAENKNLSSSEKESIAEIMGQFLEKADLSDSQRNIARYLMFLLAPGRIVDQEEQKALLTYLQEIVDGRGLDSAKAEQKAYQSLQTLLPLVKSDKLSDVMRHLEFKIKKRPSHLPPKPE